MLKRLLLRLRHVLAAHKRLALASVAAGVLITLGGVALTGGFDATPPAATSDPKITYAAEWNLLDLQRHIASGEVATITEVSDAATIGRLAGKEVASKSLVAYTTAGQYVHIKLVTTTSDAVDALNSLGYGRLLSQQVIDGYIQTRKEATDKANGGLGALPTFLIVGLLICLVVWVIRSQKRRSAGNFGRAGQGGDVSALNAGNGAPLSAVHLADVAGCEEAKLELSEAIDFLKSPERFTKLGARIPRGVLLYGPPGTGKTLLAKAIAGEAEVPFFFASGSEFVEKYVGVGASRMRELFSKARKAGASVVFIDELDAVGKARGGLNSHAEQEHTLNQLLVEMDGFASNEQVVVVAATNRVDTLDPALVRPGRFTRKVNVPMPDLEGRQAILKVHAAGKPLGPDVDLGQVARNTFGFSGAMLADVLNEGAILAARNDRETVCAEDLHNGMLKVGIGTSRSRSMDPRERSIIAAHEVGHAICGRVHGEKRRVSEISLRAHGEALGYTWSTSEDNALPAESDLRAQLVALMGGRAAEYLLFHEITGGAGNDFEKANQLAEAMVTRWGMGIDPEDDSRGSTGRGKLSFLVHREHVELPKEVLAAQARAIRHILDEAYATALETLQANMADLRRVAAYLYEHERLNGEDFDALMDHRLEPALADEWRHSTARPRAWAEVGLMPARPAAIVTPPASDPLPRRARRRTSARARLGSLLGAWSRRAVTAIAGEAVDDSV